MAKKSRRARPRTSVAAQPVRISRPERSAGPVVSKEVDFRKEYHYVVEDLKRIGILALVLLVLLVALAILIG